MAAEHRARISVRKGEVERIGIRSVKGNALYGRIMPQGLKPAVAALIVAASGMFAQSPARPTFDAFEVAAIKPAASPGGRFIKMQSAHVFFAKNHALRTLIAAAYNLTPQAISGGPAWIDSDRYDIVAKAPNDVRPTLDEQMSMLRTLLADRFKLTFHREQREFSIYALTIAKNGSKLKESTVSADAYPEGPPPLIFVLSPQGASLPGRNASMAELASVMQRAALDRPVVDRTGLAGRYDFDLEWTPDETQFGGQGPRETAESTKPGLFAAVQQQLGLRLEATKGPIDVLIIDHAERPSEN
jgi:uncharacterized protein (TIGR03435 family)